MSTEETTPTTPPTATAPSSDLAAAIIRQIEFYFSDENLPRDKFLTAKSQENPEGFVPISVLTTFKKLAALSTDVEVIANALSTSSLLALSEDKKSIRRVTPVPPQAEIDSKTVVISNCPADSTIESMTEFLGTLVGVGAVRLRRDATKPEFSGVSYVVLKSTEDCEKLVSMDPPPKIGENVLKVQLFKDAEPSKKGSKDKKRDRESPADAENERRRKEIEDQRTNFPRGCILSFTGLTEEVSKKLNFLALKDFFGHYGEVQRIDFEKGNTNGVARFTHPEGCQRALAALAPVTDPAGETAPTPVTFEGCTLTAKLMEGEEEAAWWSQSCDARLSRMESGGGCGRGRGRGNRRGGRRGRGRGRGGWGGRGRDRDEMFDDEEPASKQQGIHTVVDDGDD